MNRGPTLQELQKEIDTNYPPTHTYTIKDLGPTQVLKQRWGIIKKAFPDFFTGRRLLDIGCNTAFFSFRASPHFHHVVAIDSKDEYIRICRDVQNILCQSPGVDFLPNSNTEFWSVSFRDFASSMTFDKIFLGNGPHHLFKEIGGWEWICKLAALSSSQVLIEGFAEADSDMVDYIPKNLHAEFNTFLEKMDRFFVLKKKIPTATYTPHRFFMLFERRHFKEGEGFKKTFKRDQYVDNNKVDIFVSSTSPISNGLLRFEGDGWVEAHSSSKLYHYFENERLLFRRHCEENIFFAKLGYVDLDPATINFFRDDNRKFDKSGTVPIWLLDRHHVKLYFILLDQSYSSIGAEIRRKISAALEAKDAEQIGSAFAFAKRYLA